MRPLCSYNSPITWPRTPRPGGNSVSCWEGGCQGEAVLLWAFLGVSAHILLAPLSWQKLRWTHWDNGRPNPGPQQLPPAMQGARWESLRAWVEVGAALAGPDTSTWETVYSLRGLSISCLNWFSSPALAYFSICFFPPFGARILHLHTANSSAN